MESYRLEIDKDAQKELDKLLKSGKKIDIHKVKTIFSELIAHPHFGTGASVRLKNTEYETWSRRINKKDRLVYKLKKPKSSSWFFPF